MEALKKNKILLSILAVAIIIVIIYFSFFNGGSSSAPTSTSGTTTSDTPPAGGVGSNILTMLNTISSVSIDTTVFSSTAWTSLRDLSVPVPNNAPGRTDLFGPLTK